MGCDSFRLQFTRIQCSGSTGNDHKAVDIPFIIISGGIGEDVAVAAMKSGAHDYLMKGQLARLVVAVEELGDADHRKASAKRTASENELRYRLLWEHSNDGVVLMDAAGWILFQSGHSTCVWTSDTTLLGKHMGYLGGLGGKDSEQAPFVQELLQSNGQLMEFIGVREMAAVFQWKSAAAVWKCMGARCMPLF